ncbi:glycosyltransferase [Almyronema epifaneia]|uniref:Glycosyltransferase n=1 Tax=Almyronema epifaneia S1 TaxID=2991925 RepID=A0ABW6IAP2_9CYAN
MATFYFLVVNYYSTSFIHKLLNSGNLNHHNCEIIVVNNAADDLEIKTLSKVYKSLTVIETGENLGFGGGCNRGLSWIYQQNPHAYVWLINPDTTLDANAISYVKRCLKKYPKLAILGTRIRDSGGNAWFEIGRFNPWSGAVTHLQPRFQLAGQQHLDSASSLIVQSRWVSGCSLVVNLSQFQICPAFDENMFLYYEDSEFCERYRRQGKLVAVTQAALVTHAVSATTGQYPRLKLAHATFSKLYFLKKYGLPSALFLNLAYLLTRSFWERITGKTEMAVGRWQGIRQFLKFNLTGRKGSL